MAKHLAVITGAAGGIGAAIARSAAAAGYRPAVWDTERSAAEAVARDIGNDAVAARVDVTDEASIEAALQALPDSPRVLVNCAGINAPGPLLDVTAADWRRLLDVNLTGTFLCARAVARTMIGRGGAIVNIASISGFNATPNTGAYTSAKAGIVRLTEQMAIEWATHGIRVNAIAPGLINAGMANAVALPEDVVARRTAMIPLGRQGTADDVAAAAVFLASDAASYITGETLVVDGALSKTALAQLPTRYTLEAGNDSAG